MPANPCQLGKVGQGVKRKQHFPDPLLLPKLGNIGTHAHVRIGRGNKNCAIGL
jgi:hypothetical protein